MTFGSIIFIIGMILGLAIMIKTSNRVKSQLIRLTRKNHHTREAWQKIRA